MKELLYILAFSVIIFGCRKQIEPTAMSAQSIGFADKIRQFLNSNLSPADSAKVDYSHLYVSKPPPAPRPWLVRLAIKNKAISADFILIQSDSFGNCSEGRIVHIDKDSTSKRSIFNGSISIQGMNRGQIVSSAIINGYVQSFHPVMFSKVQGNSVEVGVVPDPSKMPDYDELPEVVVVGYLPAAGGISYGDYLLLESFMSNSSGGGDGSSGGGSSNPGGGSSGYYNPANPAVAVPGGGSSSGSSGSGGLIINYETSTNLPAINVAAYMNCFAEIPDVGSTCSVTIYTDLPVNDDPTFIFNFNTGAVGHSFLKLTKTGSGQSISQVIGFTATKPLQAMISSAAVTSKLVDNQAHKYNSSLTMNITPAQLATEISTIKSLSSMPYDLINYNCVNFSVAVMNAIRLTDPLLVPPMVAPNASFLSNTPEGLYVLLGRLKEAGGPDAPNIVTDEVNFAGSSHGACN